MVGHIRESRGHHHVGGPLGRGPRERHYVAAAVAIIAALASAYATYSASEAQAQQQKYQAKLAQNQAINAQNAAKVEAENRREHFRRQMASQRAGYAASGVTPAEGSPLLVEVDQAEQAALDLARVKYQGDVRSTTYMSESQLYKWQAKNTMRQGYIAAGASLLQGAAGAYGSYSSGAGRSTTGSTAGGGGASP